MSGEKPKRPAEAPPPPKPKVSAEGVRHQRQHIKELDGVDPLRGGVAD